MKHYIIALLAFAAFTISCEKEDKEEGNSENAPASERILGHWTNTAPGTTGGTFNFLKFTQSAFSTDFLSVEMPYMTCGYRLAADENSFDMLEDVSYPNDYDKYTIHSLTDEELVVTIDYTEMTFTK